MNYKNWPISKQIGSLVVLSSIIIYAAMSWFSYLSATTVLHDKAIEAVKSQMHSNANLIEQQYDSMQFLARRNAEILRNLYPGDFSLAGSTVEVSGVNTPVLLHENEQVNNLNDNVDHFSKLTGGVATIFARDNDDFVRVATSLKKADGNRALGTYLGSKHLGYKMLINGGKYEGYSKLFGKDYMTIYQPIKDTSGSVIAILFIGFDITQSVEQIQSLFKKMTLEESGSYVIIRNADQQVISHQKLETEAPFSEALFDGLSLEKALTDKSSWVYTSLSNQVMYSYSVNIPGWDWTLVGFVPEKELSNESIGMLKNNAILAVLGIVLISILLFIVISRAIQPLKILQGQIANLGRGDLSQNFAKCPEDSLNEVDSITVSVTKMAANLAGLIESLKQSVITLESQANLSQETSRLNGNEAKALLNQTEQIATAIEEMSSSINDVAQNASQGALQAQEVDSASHQGHTQLSQVVIALQSLSEQLIQSEKNIESVSTETQAINKITEVINAVADQTNLLALNAAIEAARAGEQGRGFAVVADEVRSLAQRTQDSLSEINSTISKLQKQVNNTSTQMVQCQQLGISSAEQADTVNNQLSQINQNIAEMALFSSSIASATKQQSTVANEVSQSLHTISTLAQNSDERATKAVTDAEQLTALAVSIKQQIGIFNLSSVESDK
ncbi:methyl-accepting chemotaxis protein [Shewanella polaris]|uniref:Methyl-accepting chemotaxis protein n=1 Tax=Shewanella polaris TaxID=2588449 RepID=A0A4Y5YGU8_9GAMM|nr:methyl-accepting chemotaxis protein [Shewanella polaris]QDE32030.1 methyl-accepting chemotaxis protein [Shewanella polaris]